MLVRSVPWRRSSMQTTRTTPAATKLVICVWHPFTYWRPQPVLPETLRRRWPEMRVVHLPDYDRLPEELPDTDIFVGYSLRPQQLELAKKLKWLHSTAAGVAQLMYPELRDSGIVVSNPSGIFSVPMAEHTMGLLVALARNFPDSVRYQDNSHWGERPASAHCGIWLDRTRTRPPRSSLRHPRLGRHTFRKRRCHLCRENPSFNPTRRSPAPGRLRRCRRPGNPGNRAPHERRANRKNETRRPSHQCRARLVAR